jgi:hypothetical protein
LWAEARSPELEKKWIEEVPAVGPKRVKITEAGIAALDAPVPPKPRKPKMKMLAPRIKALDRSRPKPRK